MLDVLICNNLGIITGMLVCRWLEMREYHWESIKNISTKSGKLKRALLQFTPESWNHARWLDPGSSYMRFLGIFQFILLFQIVELNTFFVKHIFPMPAEHPVCVFRILLCGLMAAPSTRQYYIYITDKRCKRLGSQAWVFICIAFSEMILNIKFGKDILFSQTQLPLMVGWVIVNLLIAFLGMVASMKYYQLRYPVVMTIDSQTDQPITFTKLKKRQHQD